MSEEPSATPLADVLRAANDWSTASVGRHKDFARIHQLLQQTEIDRIVLDDILQRYNVKLPKP